VKKKDNLFFFEKTSINTTIFFSPFFNNQKIVVVVIKKMGMREELELEEEKKKRTNTHKCIPHNIYFSPFFLFHIIYKLPFLLLLKHLGRHASLYTCKCITSSHVYIYRYKKKRCLPGE